MPPKHNSTFSTKKQAPVLDEAENEDELQRMVGMRMRVQARVRVCTRARVHACQRALARMRVRVHAYASVIFPTGRTTHQGGMRSSNSSDMGLPFEEEFLTKNHSA